MFRWGVGSPSAFIFARLGDRVAVTLKFLGNFNTGEILGVRFDHAPSMARDLGLSGQLICESIHLRSHRSKSLGFAFDQAGKVLRAGFKNSWQQQQTLREVIAGQTPRWNRDGRPPTNH